MSRRLLLPSIALILVVVHNWWIWPWTLDDAFIYMRYARNWVAGDGVVFNPGERCEGYSSFLWVAMLAAGHALGADLLVLAKTYCALAVIGCIALVHQAWRFVPELGRGTAAWASLLLGSCAAFSPWATGGMETPVLALWLTVFVLLYTRSRRRGHGRAMLGVGVCGALLAMLRPEGFMVAGLVGLDALAIGVARRRHGGWVRYAGGFVLVFGPFYAWRASYYGHALPNTFYAKVGQTTDQLLRGLEYLGPYLVPAALLIAPVLYAVATRSWRGRYPELRRWPLLLGAFALYIVYVGGDFMPAFRFCAPLTPLLAIMAVLSWRLMVSARAFRAVCVAVAAYGVAASELSPKLNRSLYGDEVAVGGRAVGSWIRANTPADAVVAVNAAGAMPFYSERRVVDMLGLNDTHIAHRKVPDMGTGWAGHEKGDGAYVLERRPAVVVPGSFGEVPREVVAALEADRARWTVEAQAVAADPSLSDAERTARLAAIQDRLRAAIDAAGRRMQPRYRSVQELFGIPRFFELYEYRIEPIRSATRVPFHAFGAFFLRE